MAVFPYARRALARPSRLPWLIVAVAIIATTLTLPAYSLLRETASAPDLAQAGVSPTLDQTDFTTATPPLLTKPQQILLANLTASDVQLAEAEAWFIVPRSSVPAADETPLTEYVTEVSSTTTIASPEAETSAVTSVAPALDTPVESAAVEPADAAPVAEAVAPAAAAPALPVAPVASGPVARWAAAGIIIETEGQQLDDASLANIDAALSALPASVLANLGNPAFGALHILVNTEGRVLSGDQPYNGPANFFSTNEATNELVLYPQQSVFTIVHELGHAYNLRSIDAGKYAMVLLDPEMRSFLAATGWTISSSESVIRRAVDHMHVDYSYSGSFHWPRLSNDDPLEDFANSFAMYFLDPSSLQQSSPERYAWMAGTFGN